MKTSLKWTVNGKRKLADCRAMVRAWVQRRAEKECCACGGDTILPEHFDAAIRVLNERGIPWDVLRPANTLFGGTANGLYAGWGGKAMAKALRRRGASLVNPKHHCEANIASAAVQLFAKNLWIAARDAFLVAELAGEMADQSRTAGSFHHWQPVRPRN